jgi:hypothetical protein
VGLVLVAGVIGCGGGGSSASRLDLDGVVQELRSHGIACDGKVGPYEAGSDDLDLDLGVSEEFTCTVDGTEIEGSAFETRKDLTAGLVTIKAFACGFGLDQLSLVSEGRWIVTASTADGGDEDPAMLRRIAEALDSEVRTIECDGSTRSDFGSDSDAEATTTLLDSSDLVPADEAERKAATKAALGEEIDAGDGLFLIVSDVRVGGDDEPWLAVEARAENRGGDEVSIPEFAAICAGSTEGDGWQADSTFPMYDEVRSGSFAEGTLNLLPTGNSRTGVPIEACDAPAVIRISLDDKNVDIPVPSDVLAAYNTAAGN